VVRKISMILSAAASLVLAASSRADDGTAQLGAGGIVFAKSADIRMAKEDLAISPDTVAIRFEFANDGADQDVVVAFPLPDIKLEDFYGNAIGTIGTDPVNFVGFTTTVDGKPVHAQVEQKAMLRGKDVSALVRAAGLPINLKVGNGEDQLQHLPSARRAPLVKAGLIDGDNEYPAPLWTVQTRYYWTQHFPAGKTVVIEHRYTPITGGLQWSSTSAQNDHDTVEGFCMDAPVLARLKAMSANPALRKPDPDSPPQAGGILYGEVTDYILSTAATWKGPIGHFHLTLDKLDARTVLSICWPGLKKTTPTHFEFTADNFAPKHDIHMLVLR
jgi:hypothetical protein